MPDTFPGILPIVLLMQMGTINVQYGVLGPVVWEYTFELLALIFMQ